MNRQQPLQEMFTQELPPLRVANARTPAVRTNENKQRHSKPCTSHTEICQKGVNLEFTQECKRSLSAKYYGEQQRKQVSGTHLDKFSNPATFQCWETSFKTDECRCSPIRTRTERHRSCTVKLVARFVRMVGGFHRKCGGPRSVSIKEYTRKHFS